MITANGFSGPLGAWQGQPSDLYRALRYQYALSAGAEVYPGMTCLPFAGSKLWVGGGLNVCHLTDRTGQTVGYALGVAVARSGVLGQSYKLRLTSEEPGCWERLEEFIDQLAGRYAVLVDLGGVRRLYTDPVGAIGAVYNRQTQRVAASPFLTLDDTPQPDPLFDAHLIEAGKARYGLFHTSDARVRRMNPSCFLDLDQLEETRFWPRGALETTDGPDREIYQRIIETTARNMAHLMRNFRCVLPLTGGHDSRLLLSIAAGRDLLGEVDYAYTHINNYAGRVDAALGAQMAEVAGMPFEVHDFKQVQVKHWQQRRVEAMHALASGCCTPAPNEYRNRAYSQLPDGAMILRGHQTDVLRAVLIVRGPEAWDNPSWQLRRLNMVPPNGADEAAIWERYKTEFMAWRAALPEHLLPRAADLSFLEMHNAHSVGAAFPANWRNFYVSPFNSRQLIGWAHQFSYAFRRSTGPVHDIIELACPELSQVPFDHELTVRGDALMEQAADHAGWGALTAKRRAQTAARLSGAPLEKAE